MGISCCKTLPLGSWQSVGTGGICWSFVICSKVSSQKKTLSICDVGFLHWPAEAWDLGDEAAVRRRLRLELDDVARKRALQGYEIPRDFILERDAFSKANYLLTDSGKPAVGRLREKCAPAPCNCCSMPARVYLALLVQDNM